MQYVYTIHAKMSAFNIDSTRYDRDIVFDKGHKFAVVFAGAYLGKGYTTHKTLKGAAKESAKNRENGHIVIDREGNRIDL